MHLWSGPAAQFIEESVRNQIPERLKAAFVQYHRYEPPPSEVQSWRNSLRAMSQVVQAAQLDESGVLLEYQLPLSSKRLDCMLTGVDHKGSPHATIVELKQWERAEPAEGDRVMTFVGGGHREVLHPSAQVLSYRGYLADMNAAFYEAPYVDLNACSYLHNYAFRMDDALLDDRYTDYWSSAPVFSLNDVDLLINYLQRDLSGGQGLPILQRVLTSRFRPSKKLMDHVANVIGGRPEYNLLDDQLIVFDQVKALLKRPLASGEKTVALIRGGPGTGKSVIAINLMADALLEGHNTHYATGSKAFTETLRKIIGKRGGGLFTYFNSYGQAVPGDVDLLVADEAHRIRHTSASRFTPKAKRTDLPQIDELLKAARVAAFFVDDRQAVRPNEIGSSEYIRQAAERTGAKVREYELAIQFRCGSSDSFVNWIENTLGIRRSPNVLWEGHPDFDFRIVDNPHTLERLIHDRHEAGHSARLVAGFCWKWNLPDEAGNLPDDVVIEEHGFRRPWDAHYNARKLAPGIPKASLWAYDPNGIGQIGCVYTAQGFEFDYVGVIFGKDLVYDWETGSWVGQKEHSADSMVKRSKEEFVELVKNTYRVLFSRGMRGCYVYFMDEGTRRFFQSRTDVVA